MSGETRRAAAAVGAIGSEDTYRSLLQAVVDVARAIFAARAASVFLLDEEADELVFEAVSGEGEDTLVGVRFPAGTGIAGWVLTTRQPLVLENVADDPRFAREAAERTGYVPTSLVAVPLLSGERALGVLNVLDRPPDARSTLSDLELLGLFATQAAIALDLLLRARRARAALAGEGSAADAAIARLVAALEGGDLDEPAVRLLGALADLLDAKGGAA